MHPFLKQSVLELGLQTRFIISPTDQMLMQNKDLSALIIKKSRDKWSKDHVSQRHDHGHGCGKREELRWDYFNLVRNGWCFVQLMSWKWHPCLLLTRRQWVLGAWLVIRTPYRGVSVEWHAPQRKWNNEKNRIRVEWECGLIKTCWKLVTRCL